MSNGGWVIDTDVVSETAKPRPDPDVMAWLAELTVISLSSVTVYELARGVARLARAVAAGNFWKRGSPSSWKERTSSPSRATKHSWARGSKPRPVAKGVPSMGTTSSFSPPRELEGAPW